MSTQWTPFQSRAIRTTGINLLVSAAAGSGKTAVLAERCAYLVCDADDPCDVSELLVVTFTNAAAEEMRKRIGQAIAKRAAASDNPRLHHQAMLIHTAQISTIHSLGQSIIRRHFHDLGIDPNFRLLDEDEARLLRSDLVEGMLESRFDDPEAQAFRQVVDQYASGNARAMGGIVLSLHAKMASLVDREAWLRARREKIVEAIEKPLSQSRMGQDALNILSERLTTLANAASQLAMVIDRYGTLGPYAQHVREIEHHLRDWDATLKTANWDAIAAVIADFKFDTIPRLKASPEKEAMKLRIDSLKARIRKFIDDNLFTFTESALREGLSQTLAAIDEISSLVRNFEAAYRQAKRDTAALDFNDLEHLALTLLREPDVLPPQPSRIALEYRQQFRHVMVDEYQDVNEVQDTILDLLSSGQNHFAVGDVKQSIYRFRQADPERFRNRYLRYAKEKPAPGELILLQSNFRSRGRLLEALNGIFELLMTRESAEVIYNSTQRLIPGTTFPESPELFAGTPIEFHLIEKESPGAVGEYETDEREALLAASRIRALLGYDGHTRAQVVERDGSSRLIEPRDMVLLLRAMRVKAERFASILRRAGIPVQADSSDGFFSATEIGDMLASLKLLANRRDDIALAAFLRSPLSGWSGTEAKMAQIRLAYPTSNSPCFHQAFERYARDGKDVSLVAELKGVNRLLEEWRALSRTKSVADVLWAILDTTSYLTYIIGLPDGEQRVANVLHLHQRARQFENFQRPTVARFLEFLRELEAESDLGLPPAAGAAQNAVRIMSVHKSKGLEFPVVILPDLGKAHNMRDVHDRLLLDDKVGLAARVVDLDKEVHYASLATMLAASEIRRKAIAEEMRVLYVAGTRAREHLILIGTGALDLAQEWDDTWIGHTGPLPPGDVRDGTSMLDWIGPSAAIVESHVPGTFKRTVHHAADIEQLGESILQRQSRDDAAAILAQLKPLDGLPASAPSVVAAIARLDQTYEFAELTGISALTTVTTQTKAGRAAPGGAGVSAKGVIAFDTVLKPPRSIDTAKLLSPADAGSITHTVLQHLDFTQPCDAPNLQKQIASMVERRFLHPDDFGAVKTDVIEWLVKQSQFAPLRAGSAQLLREFSITYTHPADAAAATRDDLIMVRGRLDAVIVEDDGLTLIDYKTDNVNKDTVTARAAFYQGQIDAYREQLEKLTHRPIKAAFLIFLTPRLILPA